MLIIIFKLKDIFGPDHQRTFEIQVIIGNKILEIIQVVKVVPEKQF